MKSASAVLGAAVLAVVVACSTQAPVQTGGAASKPVVEAASHAPFVAAYRRLTESQYRHAISDAFSPNIVINARFEPERREEGLMAVGSTQLSVTTTGLEQYLAVARSVSDQLFSDKHPAGLVGCGIDPGPPVPACADTFLATTGQKLFRRPLSASELAGFKAVWQEGFDKSGNANKALGLALISMLMSPEFLFRVERAEADPARPGAYRLDGYGKAMRLSFTLWDAPPDAELAGLARSGVIHDPAVLKAQVERMLASPKAEAGLRAFFTDMLQFDAFDTLSKDASTYPNFSQAVADGAREETLKFLADHLIAKGGDYRDIFTSRETILNRALASVYDVPYPSTDPWTKVTFPEKSERAGVLTQVTFLSLFSHPAASSPTVRGVKLNEVFACVVIPQPPPDVDFSKVQALEKGTVRTRLIDHMTNKGCSVCHTISDPPGLSLEKFDGLGQFRASENGQPIDVSATVGGKSFNGSVGLGRYMHDNPDVTSCLVKRANAYGAGRAYGSAETKRLADQGAAFAAAGYKWAPLMRGVLNDPQFYSVPAPAVQAAAIKSSLGEGR